jgi:parallel beta-helix repeat protein
MAIVQDCFLHDFALATGVSGENTAAIVINQDLAEAYEGAVWVQRNRIEMTTAPEDQGDSVAGIQITANNDAYTRPVFVLDNILRNMGQDIAGNIIAPIQIYRNGPGSVIRGNRIYRSYWGGIKVQRSSDIIIEGNLIQDVGEHGPTGASAIHVQSRVPELASARIQIVNNIVDSMDPIPAITITAGSESFSDVIVAGNIIDGALRGISPLVVPTSGLM